jgi:hypothetical protein
MSRAFVSDKSDQGAIRHVASRWRILDRARQERDERLIQLAEHFLK